MVLNGEMNLGRPDRSLCDDYMFGCIRDDDENACEGVTDEIDAINDETFGDDVQGSINSELEDYAAQTAFLRLDDGAPWDAPGCSKAPAPDASNVPIPDFDIFGNSSFSTFGSETMAKLDSLWNQRSHNLYELWEEQKGATTSQKTVNSTQQASDISSNSFNTASNAYSTLSRVPHTVVSASSPFVQPRPSVLPPMPRCSTLEDLERKHLPNVQSITGICPVNNVKSTVVNATDLERRFLEEATAVSPSIRTQVSHCMPQQTSFTSLPSPQGQTHPGLAPSIPPNFGNIPP
ncbi:hypothetical protein NECAME_04094, partial [Necator americanus]